MEIHVLASSVVNRVLEMEERLRQPLLWQVTDVLLIYERQMNEARKALQDADMALLAAGMKKTDLTRRRIARVLSDMSLT